MEEEVGIKVTRSRRRLSVESDDVKSPSTPSTPTKKRGGRLAAKPQLELIDENAPEAAPKRTRKSTARDIVEPIEEKAVTPSRRSTRIRSNTSIVSETTGDGAEDKGTPSRRSTRIKSNTSIVAESVQSVNSPRAKRAARRTSQAGSDNETPVTPARQTRRTLKDSTSSIDKQAELNAVKVGSQVNEVIVEESENNYKETKSSESPIRVSPTLRKSPRLVGKNGRKSTSLDNDNKENEPQSDKDARETTTDADKSVTETKTEQINEIVDQITSESNNLSVASTILIKELDEAPKKGKNFMNKSTTAVEEPQIKSKRNRTKSWTTISIEPSHENSFCSDSEASKKSRKKKSNTFNCSNISGSGDGIMNINNKNDGDGENSMNLSEKKKKKRNEMSIRDDTEISVHETSVFNKSENLKEDCKNNKEVTDNINLSKKHNSNATEQLFEQAPSDLIQSLVFIEDSDSNQGSTQKGNKDKDFDSGDQCVPVVEHNLGEDESSKDIKNNLSYEPMDIDETMPENVSLTTFTDKNMSISHEDQEPISEKRNSILNNTQVKNNSINKSKRKSSISNNTKEEYNNAEMINDDVVVNKDFSKSKRKSSISTNAISEDTTDGISYTSDKKNVNMDNDNTVKKSKRKSSISNITIENNIAGDSNESFKKTPTLDDIAKNESMHKLKRNSSVVSKLTPEINTSQISYKHKNKSLLVDPDIDENTEISVKSNRKSSIAEIVNKENTEKKLSKSKRKSAVSTSVSEVSIDEGTLPISNVEHDVSMEKSPKCIRKSSISPMESQNLDRTDKENKSTLVLSQLKDVSETDINMNNAPKDSNESNDQFSKSISMSNVITEKECDKKNISLTYKTSTPLQQKSLKKLGMHINSSIIAPNSASKLEQKNNSNRSKKEASILSQKVDSSDSSEEEEESSEEEEKSSFERSKMIDAEAEDAGGDYESGDSRDDDEKEYEEQNEIVEKGETLDTEDENEFSDDSEYEKGSFIVSSDEEDDDLLSGSGDDLSLSADELSMSAKSKKKYNERKVKEQKKASREMFEARHKKSEKGVKLSKQKSKKNNRQRFDSTSSDSEEEVTAPLKKNTRQRIDSYEDISMTKSDADMSQKKKKVKRLSESVCEHNATNEKEITIREETETEKNDPLTLQNIIKEEPKTPQKELNISTVAVTNMDEVEEVNVDENVSMIKSNKTLACDPLQTTIAENDAEYTVDEDSISENEEITQNYESVLNNLNVSNSKKIKSFDASLNLDKKTKQIPKEPIVDQLNLTQIKNTKKSKPEASKKITLNKKLDKSMNKKGTDKMDTQVNNMFSEGSSDSIDMKLLFPEDSNDSEVIVVKTNSNDKKLDANVNTQKENVQETPESFIPLKRTEGKTNMLENIDVTTNSKDESFLNVSNKKKNKRNTSQTEETITMSTQEDNVSFFIDTTGTLNDVEKTDVNTSIKNSSKKNKQKNNMIFSKIEETKVDEDSNDAPLEVSYRSEKNKSKQNLNITQHNDETEEGDPATATPNQSAKKKKKNKKSLNSSQNVTEISIIENADSVAEQAINSSVTKGNAKKKKMSESQIDQKTENTEHAETILNISLGSAKKQKQNAISENCVSEEEIANKDDKDTINNEDRMSKKRKRKSSANQTVIEENTDKDNIKLNTSAALDESSATKNKKKKRKMSNNDANSQVQESQETQEHEKVPVEISKKKDEVQELQEPDAIVEEATKKTKKRKTREDDDACKISKVLKQNSFDKVHVPRLPVNVISQLGDKPKENLHIKKPKVISTTSFEVKETKKRGKNPSSYLEESVYLNDDLVEKKKKGSIKYPKTLPSIPNALTSVSGFTTNFRVNPIPQQTQFVAQSSDIPNFKNDYLNKKRIKKLGTFELYKRQRNIKISKF